MPFGLGKKETITFNTDISDKDDLDEIKKIAERLDQDEKVLVVARQSRVRPGGSITTPAILFATSKRLIIRDPSLGLHESIEDIPYDRLTSALLGKGVFSSSIMLRPPGLSTLSEKLNMLQWKKGSDEGEIDAIPKDKAERIVHIIKKGMEDAKKPQIVSSQTVSIADELAKLAKLRDQRIITEAEFQQMKQDMMKKN